MKMNLCIEFFENVQLNVTRERHNIVHCTDIVIHGLALNLSLSLANIAKKLTAKNHSNECCQ